MLEAGDPEVLTRTSSVIVASAKIQVHVLAVVYATVVPPRDPVCVRQPPTPLRLVKEQAVPKERRPMWVGDRVAR